MRAEERDAFIDALSQPDIDALAADIKTNPKIVTTKAASGGFEPTDISSQLKATQQYRARPSEPLPVDEMMDTVRGRTAVTEPMPASPTKKALDAMPEASADDGIIGMLKRTNTLTAAMSYMFPKVMAAKMVIQKYGARIAGAAESAMSNKVFQMTARKAPVIAWAKLVAPEGDDRDRNLRAIYAISESPGAFDAAVDQALGDIEADSPEQRVKAREVVTAQIQWLVQNAPASLSTLKKVWSPSTIAHFNRLIDAWQDPVGVMSRVQQAPTEQINAVRELWPTSYSEFMTKVVEQVAEHAAAGKAIPRGIGRILPMASPSWSVGGMQMLQSQQTQPVEMDQSGKFNSQTVAPTTVSESLSSNRINLNK